MICDDVDTASVARRGHSVRPQEGEPVAGVVKARVADNLTVKTHVTFACPTYSTLPLA